MLRNLNSRRRPRYGPQICAGISALLLLFSVSLLYTNLTSSHQNATVSSRFKTQNDAVRNNVETEQNDTNNEQNDIEEEQEEEDEETHVNSGISSNGYFIDHVTGSIRRSLKKKSIEEWDSDWNLNSFSVGFSVEDNNFDVKSKAAFGSDDVIVDEEIKRKLSEVNGIEDALLLKIGKKVSPLREGWGDWFDKKSDFLRRDKMFKSNLEVLNPLNNPLLQDPDGVGVTGLTRGDKAVQKMILSEFRKYPLVGKRSLSVLGVTHDEKVGEKHGEGGLERRTGVKRAERRTLDEFSKRVVSNVSKDVSYRGNENVSNEVDGRNLMIDKKSSNGSYTEEVRDDNAVRNSSENRNLVNKSSSGSVGGGEVRQMVEMENGGLKDKQRKPEESSHVFADGKRWGYFPGLHPHLSFSDFMDSFFSEGEV